MEYFSGGWLMVYLFSGVWLWGWIASVLETNIGQEPWGFFKIRGIVLLFFIWPYIAYCMMNQGDI